MPELLHLLFAEDLDLEAQLGQLLHPPGELLGIEDVGRLGDEVAGEDDGVCQPVETLGRLLGGGRVIDRDPHLGDRGFLVGLFLGAVFVEPIGGEPHAQGGMTGHGAGRRPAGAGSGSRPRSS